MATTHAPLETRPAPEKPASRLRDPWFDNTKLLLVTLVVVGHTWTLLPETAFNNWLYDFLYLWHMPAFVMVTGYLSRSFRWSRRHLTRLLTGVLVPYLVFEGALVLFRELMAGGHYRRMWLEPHWPMWFLVALFLWRLATPVLKSMPKPVLGTVVVSLLGGLHQFDLLDLNRVFGLLPFFAAGLVARPEHVIRLRGARARTAALAVIGVGATVPQLVLGRLPTEWLYYRSSYATLDVPPVEGMAIRLLLLALSAAMALAFMSWIPGRGGWFTRLGAASLVVYLFHGFVVKSAVYAGFPGWAAGHPTLSLLVGTGAAVVLSLSLAAPPVAHRLGKLVEPTRGVRPLLAKL